MTNGQQGAGAVGEWPALLVREWADTRDTLHMWTQVVGKIRLAMAPMVNHWWQVPLYVSARGLTTSLIPHDRRSFDIEFDFCEHQLHIRSSSGDERRIPLAPKSVAEFYRETMAALRELDLEVSIWTKPREVERAIPFEADTEHAAYRPEHAHLFWRQLLAANRVLTEFRSRFVGKVSPVHFFWGAMDLAVTRFSGRTAPEHPGGAPNCADWVMVEGYSHELSSCGFWPGGTSEGTFYSYAYPEPAGYAEQPVRPAAANYSAEVGEYLLPYESVRTATDPEGTLLEFLQTSYEAAAGPGKWDRRGLETSTERA
ncbi:DUF5996 family protein [Saccharopolyspora phatthalungensis]|uniref:Ava_C0101 and related proteins n=1 Tax=Saccharopolyspora phatthalungensis TaxID=664693 RepID=A0A840QEY7_9PSEU|nr:DUF5996 family protein [Saccharopolyspora phatthalungensis]MBB5158450.1 hypothetical protein [Saccharopolyspora phatthalungensis]